MATAWGIGGEDEMCRVCGYRWDGSEVYSWRGRGRAVFPDVVEEFDMDQMEIEVRRENEKVRRERKRGLEKCGRCGKKWKGLVAHQKKCL